MTPEEARMKIKAAKAREKIRAAKAASSSEPKAPTSSESPEGPGLLGRAINAALGAIQGVTANLGDEASGLINAGLDAAGRAVGWGDQTATFDSDRKLYRDRLRDTNKRAQAESNGEYGFVELVGGAFTPAGKVKTVGQAALKLGGAGALTGFGASEDTGLGLAGDTLLGGALGAGFGSATQGVANALRKAPEALTDLSRTSAVKTFNPTTMQMEKIQALPGGEGALGQTLLDLGIVKAGDNAESAAAKFQPAFKKAGKDVGAVYEAADKAAPGGFDVGKLVDAFSDRVTKMKGNAATAEFAPQAEKMGLQAIETYGDKMPFTKAHDYASKLGKLAYGSGSMDPGVSKALREETSDVAKGTLRDQVEGVLGKGALSEKDALYKQLETMKRPVRRTLAGNKSTRGFSASDYWTGGTGATVGSVIGGATAGPIGAAVGGLVGGIGSAALNKGLRNYGRAALADGSQKGAIAAAKLVKMLDDGEPVATVIQQATALGIPREVIQLIQEENK